MLVQYIEKNFKFADIFRVIISGSSGVGKTSFVKQLIQARLFNSDRVVLCHPDACESVPVDWHISLDTDVVYKVGLPDVEYLKSLPEYTTIVIDDLFDQAVSSQTIDYLVRVLSSKRKLHVFLLAQHYFAKGRLGVSIRDSCNYHVLMPGNNRSIDVVARNFKLTEEIQEAEKCNQGKRFPYIFIARDNTARAANIQVFTEILDRLKLVIIGRMKYYLVAKTDFDTCLKVKDSHVAEYVPEPQNPNNSPKGETKTNTSDFKRRRRFEKQVERAIRRHKVRARIQC